MLSTVHRDIVDPADPRAPDEATWALMTDEERRQVVAMLDTVIAHKEAAERERLEAIARTEKLEADLAEERRARAEAERRIQDLEAQLARRNGSGPPS